MLHRHDCDIWGFDSTPKSLRYWNEEKKDKTKWRRFHHQAYLIASADGPISLELPKGHGVSYAESAFNRKGMTPGTKIELEARSLPTIMQSLHHERVDLVKLDVEGSEFAIFDAWPTYRPKPRVCQVLVEWHTRLVQDGEARKAQAIHSMKMAGYEAHMTPTDSNNPDGQTTFRNDKYCIVSGTSSNGIHATTAEEKAIISERLNHEDATKTFKWRQPASNPGGKPSRTLLTIHTSHNAWGITQLMLVSLASSTDEFDVLLIDDHSDQYDQNALAEGWGVQVLRFGKASDAPKGTTYSWNLAWKHAIENGYENIIICNNDLLVPNDTVRLLTEALDSGSWEWLLPTTSCRGTKYDRHRLKDHWSSGKDCVADWTNHPLSFARVSRALVESSQHGPDVVLAGRHGLNGYMMAFNVPRMRKHEHAPGVLFDPKNINLGNEDQLFREVKARGDAGRVGVVKNAFVFHFKGYTLYKAKSSLYTFFTGSSRSQTSNKDFPKDMGFAS